MYNIMMNYVLPVFACMCWQMRRIISRQSWIYDHQVSNSMEFSFILLFFISCLISYEREQKGDLVMLDNHRLGESRLTMTFSACAACVFCGVLLFN
jgi:hypothetical protein